MDITFIIVLHMKLSYLILMLTSYDLWSSSAVTRNGRMQEMRFR